MQIKISNTYDDSKLQSDIETIKRELKQIYDTDNVVVGEFTQTIGKDKQFKKVLNADVFVDGNKIPDVDVWKLGPGYKMLDELLDEFKNKKGE